MPWGRFMGALRECHPIKLSVISENETEFWTIAFYICLKIELSGNGVFDNRFYYGNILIVLPDRQTQFFRSCHEAAHKCHFQFSFCIQLVGVAIAPSGKGEGSDADR